MAGAKFRAMADGSHQLGPLRPSTRQAVPAPKPVKKITRGRYDALKKMKGT